MDAIVYKTCRKLFIGNNSNCTILYESSNSEAAKKMQEIVQPHLATLFISMTSIEIIFPMIFCLFLGSWSDTNGRKPPIILPFIGSIIYYLLFAILNNLDIDSYWFLIPSIIFSVMGGIPAITLMSFCYIADITSNENRAWRLGFLDFVFFGGQLVGFIVSPMLFKEFGYLAVFATSVLSCVLGLLYTLFFLTETVCSSTNRNYKTIFDLTLIKEMFRTTTRKRDGFDRCMIWCCFIIIAIHDDMLRGTATILYLFTKRFGWSISDFYTFSAIQLVITMSGMMLLIKIIAPLLKLPDTVSIMIATLFDCGSLLVKAFATKSWHLYLSASIGMFFLATSPLIRSTISKIVSEQDIGKAYAVTTAMELLGPFATNPLFVLLHTNFIKTYPSPVWFLPAVLCLFIVILVIVVEYRWRRLKKIFLQ